MRAKPTIFIQEHNSPHPLTSSTNGDIKRLHALAVELFTWMSLNDRHNF